MSSKKMPHRSVLMARTPALSSVAVSLSVMMWPSAGYSSAGATETVVGIVIEPLFSFGIAMGAVSRKAGRRHANRICIVTYTSANPIIRNGGNISVSLCICNDFTESREYDIVAYSIISFQGAAYDQQHTDATRRGRGSGRLPHDRVERAARQARRQGIDPRQSDRPQRRNSITASI